MPTKEKATGTRGLVVVANKATQFDSSEVRGTVIGLEYTHDGHFVSVSSVITLLSDPANRSGLYAWPTRPWPSATYSSGSRNKYQHVLSHLPGWESHLTTAPSAATASSSSSSTTTTTTTRRAAATRRRGRTIVARALVLFLFM